MSWIGDLWKLCITKQAHDGTLGGLMALLQTELEQGGQLGRLYSDHLAHALATRLLFLKDAERQSAQPPISPLPRLALRRVLDRMQDISTDVDLEMLAAESGYSRGHF
jgi:AraC family transcriptional regulator